MLYALRYEERPEQAGNLQTVRACHDMPFSFFLSPRLWGGLLGCFVTLGVVGLVFLCVGWGMGGSEQAGNLQTVRATDIGGRC